jgi:alanine-synthesizing transaminase
LTLTFNSLSKSYRSCGYRAGWMVVSGDKRPAKDYIEGLNMLSNMRFVPTYRVNGPSRPPWADYQSINELVGEGGRLRRQRDLAYELITAIPGCDLCETLGCAVHVSQARPGKIYPIADDQQFFLELLQETRVMLVQGTGFNWSDAGPLPHCVPAPRRRPARGHRPCGQVPGKLPQTSHPPQLISYNFL